jgi:hypothetical protein
MTENTNKSQIWSNFENYAILSAKFSWILVLIYCLVALIMGIVGIVGLAAIEAAYNPILDQAVLEQELASAKASIAWYFIQLFVMIIFDLIYIKPRFANKFVAKDWTYLVNDVISLGSIRIPKMVFFAVLAIIFSNGWGSTLFVAPVVLYIFFGPIPIQWKK